VFSAVAQTDLAPDDRIALWERQTRWWIVLAAVAPFVSRLVPGDTSALNLAVDLVTWAVFATDFAVHLWMYRSYWREGRGLFDISILVLTFPWYVIPGVGGTAFMTVFRWARLARLLFSGETGRRLLASMRRLGTLGIALAFTSTLSALIVLRNEPADSGFETLGDALWWAMVSFTTVGYGDLYPTTPAGRVAAGLMMFMGLIALGTVSGVLASAFSEDRAAGRAAADTDGPSANDGVAAAGDELLTEVRRLREELADLRAQLVGRGRPSAPSTDTDRRQP
jgi:voltage-gated potassium channel